jgi:hypothetical protein
VLHLSELPDILLIEIFPGCKPADQVVSPPGSLLATGVLPSQVVAFTGVADQIEKLFPLVNQ